jgi:hypothetical protein
VICITLIKKPQPTFYGEEVFGERGLLTGGEGINILNRFRNRSLWPGDIFPDSPGKIPGVTECACGGIDIAKALDLGKGTG